MKEYLEQESNKEFVLKYFEEMYQSQKDGEMTEFAWDNRERFIKDFLEDSYEVMDIIVYIALQGVKADDRSNYDKLISDLMDEKSIIVENYDNTNSKKEELGRSELEEKVAMLEAAMLDMMQMMSGMP